MWEKYTFKLITLLNHIISQKKSKKKDQKQKKDEFKTTKKRNMALRLYLDQIKSEFLLVRWKIIHYIGILGDSILDNLFAVRQIQKTMTLEDVQEFIAVANLVLRLVNQIYLVQAR